MTELSLSPVILLCGGKSSRMGKPKGLVSHKGHPWMEHQLRSLKKVGITEVVIVLGYAADEYLRALPWLVDALLRQGTEAFGLHVRALVNPLPEYGPFSSIQAGGANAQRLAHAFSRFFWVLPIDVPCPDRLVWTQLARSEAAACVPTYAGRGGHPVRLSDAFLRRLRRIPPYGQDSRLDQQIRMLGPLAERMEVGDSKVVKNLNRPQDFAGFS